MGDLVCFPGWKVIAREEGSTRGEPRVLVDPSGRRHEVLAILRRRLVSGPRAGSPIRHEADVRTDIGVFRVTWTEPSTKWEIGPL